MWDIYDDDDSFEKMAKAKVMHDARLLAKVLYGKGKTNTAQAQTTESKPATKIQEGPKTRRELKFSAQSGQFFVHPSLVYDDCHQPGEETGHKVLDCGDQTDPTLSLLNEHHPDIPFQDDPACYVWRSQDYSFLPVRPPDQFSETPRLMPPAKTDVLVFNRKSSSEYDKEREELKDSVLAWKLRYQERQNKELS